LTWFSLLLGIIISAIAGASSFVFAAVGCLAVDYSSISFSALFPS